MFSRKITCALIAAALSSVSLAAPPTVKIVSPKPDGIYEENAQVRYEIDVPDRDDGESKFQEINSTAVLLIVRHFSSSEAAEAAMSGPIADDPPGLRTLRTSDCLNCHAFDARLVGPSFTRIRKRYPSSQATVDSLSRHILQGTSGAWSNIKMPSHPELTMEQAAACVTWILKTAADPDTNYYTGTEGTFRVAVPSDSKGKGMLVLFASYTDSRGMQGRDAIRIQIH
jgi:cytochrome c